MFPVESRNLPKVDHTFISRKLEDLQAGAASDSGHSTALLGRKNHASHLAKEDSYTKVVDFQVEPQAVLDGDTVSRKSMAVCKRLRLVRNVLESYHNVCVRRTLDVFEMRHHAFNNHIEYGHFD